MGRGSQEAGLRGQEEGPGGPVGTKGVCLSHKTKVSDVKGGNRGAGPDESS